MDTRPENSILNLQECKNHILCKKGEMKMYKSIKKTEQKES